MRVGGACSLSDLVGGADFFPLPLALAWRGFFGLSDCSGKNKSSAVCPKYLKAVVTPHLCSRYATRKNETSYYRSRYVTSSHQTPHIRHANAVI